MFFEYDRVAAVEYARKWALSRNPQFKDYEQWGGNCTNYISQCINAGGIPMDSDGNNVMKEWYWYSDNKRTPSWTGAQPFLNILQVITHMILIILEYMLRKFPMTNLNLVI